MAQNQTNRSTFFLIISLLAVMILLARVFFIQFFVDENLKKRALGNKVRTLVVEPARGRICDRNGTIIVDNEHAYNLYIVPEVLLANPWSVEYLTTLFGDSQDSLYLRFKQNPQLINREICYQRDISLENFAKIEENHDKLKGIKVKNEWKRSYFHQISPHILGYIAEAKSETEIDDVIKLGDLRGKDGIEFYYDQILRGKRGIKRELRDVHNKKIADYEVEKWSSGEEGKDLWLTIDLDLQKYIEELFANRSGSAVVMDVNSGEVLAMVSKPDYPVDLFSKTLSKKDWDYWSNHPEKPLLNKATLAEYPPGSVLKMSSIIAAYEDGKITRESTAFCRGGLQVGNRFIKCWNHGGHGTVNGVSALMGSCDTYFYDLAYKIDLDHWADKLRQLGLGAKTGIDLRYEKEGNIPDRAYYQQRNRAITTGALAILMIGQGEVLTTPLQIALNTMYIANGGIKYRPHLFYKAKLDSLTTDIYQQKPGLVKIDGQPLQMSREGMYAVVNSGAGTAHKGYSANTPYAGKTGTAQNAHGKDHAWFTAYAPYKKPEITVTLFQAHGESGSSLSPMARDIIEKWRQLKYQPRSQNQVLHDSLKTK